MQKITDVMRGKLHAGGTPQEKKIKHLQQNQGQANVLKLVLVISSISLKFHSCYLKILWVVNNEITFFVFIKEGAAILYLHYSTLPLEADLLLLEIYRGLSYLHEYVFASLCL